MKYKYLDIQNKDSYSWGKLCEYVDKVSENGEEEFSPAEYLGRDLFSEIFTLPNSISKLTKVKKIWLYGSQLRYIPPEIGQMKSLEYFDPYTSYYLNWFPYELTRCRNIIDSRVSTRALFGNKKNRSQFPNLNKIKVLDPARKFINCSNCNKKITPKETDQYWISLWIGTDCLPLLVNSCSQDCTNNLPTPTDNYIKHPHKGGEDLVFPEYNSDIAMKEWNRRDAIRKKLEVKKEEGDQKGFLKLIKKIWDR